MPPKKAIEKLTGLVNNAWPLKNEPWTSPKREEWTITARGVLERAFSPSSSLIQRFDTAETSVSYRDTSDEELREMANSTLDSQLAILRSAIEQLSWEVEDKPQSTTERRAAERDKETSTQSNASGLGPLDILREAIKAVPAVKYALGIAGIVSVIAITKGFNIDFRIAVFGTIIMLALMTLLVIFARLPSISPSKLMLPALTFAWFVLLLTIATASLLFTSVFWRWPVDLQNWLKQNTADATKEPATQFEQHLPQIKLRFRGDNGPIELGRVSKNSGAVVAKVEVTNSGTPSTLRDWTMSIRTPGNREFNLGLLAESATGDTTLKTHNNRIFEVLARQDFIPEKTATEPIPTGGTQVGFVAFEFPLSARTQIEQLGTTFTISVTDVAGHLTAQQLTTVRGSSGNDRPVYVPGMQPNLGASANVAGPLKEWQRAVILQTLSQFPGHKVLILTGIGDETAAYAGQFHDLFQKAKWIVDGPRPAPVNQPVLDIQISTDAHIYTHPEIQPILSAFKSVALKRRQGPVRDPNIPSDWIVLWVGARTPEAEPEHISLAVPKETFKKLR